MGKILTEGLSDDKEVVQLDPSTASDPSTSTLDLIKGIDAIVHLLDTDIKTDVSTHWTWRCAGHTIYCGWLAKKE